MGVGRGCLTGETGIPEETIWGEWGSAGGAGGVGFSNFITTSRLKHGEAGFKASTRTGGGPLRALSRLGLAPVLRSVHHPQSQALPALGHRLTRTEASHGGIEAHRGPTRLSHGDQCWNRREGDRAQPLKAWHSLRTWHIGWLEPNRSKMADESTSSSPWASLYAHCHTLAKWHTHRHRDSSKADHKGQKVGGGPASGNPHPFPKIAGILLPLISLWNYPPLSLKINFLNQ